MWTARLPSGLCRGCSLFTGVAMSFTAGSGGWFCVIPWLLRLHAWLQSCPAIMERREAILSHLIHVMCFCSLPPQLPGSFDRSRWHSGILNALVLCWPTQTTNLLCGLSRGSLFMGMVTSFNAGVGDWISGNPWSLWLQPRLLVCSVVRERKSDFYLSLQPLPAVFFSSISRFFLQKQMAF